MSYVETVLLPDETVLSWTRLHWFIYLRSFLILILGVAVFIAGSFAGQQAEFAIHVVAAIILVIGLVRLFFAWIRRRSTELAVTDRRVIHKTGFFGRTTHEMNRDKVESVDVQQSMAGRMFGYGTILVRGTGSSWEPFTHVENPLAFRSNITAT